jgi:hypothetical protein
MGIAMSNGQYHPGSSLVEEALVALTVSGCLNLGGYNMYHFFVTDQKKSEMGLVEVDQNTNLDADVPTGTI